MLVLVFSSHANQSPQVGREVERAVNRGIPIVPLRIENISPTQSLEYFIGTVHWLDALTPPVESICTGWAKRCRRCCGSNLRPRAQRLRGPRTGVPDRRRSDLGRNTMVAA